MELITMGIGYIVTVFAKNKAVNSAVDDFVTGSVEWVRGWFKQTDNKPLLKKLKKDPESEEVQQEMNSALAEMAKNDQFKKEFELWVKENQKPNPSLKNFLENADIKVKGNFSVGDKNDDGRKYDQKNVIKKSKIKAGADFNLGDS